MKRNIVAAAFFVGALSLCGAGISSATKEQKHVDEALAHVQTAINEGQRGTANAVVEQHAKQALEHAKQAERVKPDPHITEAETHLSQAIDSAATGHKDIAAKHAQEAIRQLQMAYGGTGGKY